MWNSFLFQNTTVEDVHSATPFVISDDVAGNRALFLAAVSGHKKSPVLRPVTLSPQADFIPRLVFATVIERFPVECRKTKTKVIILTNHAQTRII